ncbi:MAG: leucine-rich repeat protein [Agathobacter sp.]|nr:leucine-rich repeat protein [Agathobacter sp.]
MTYTVSQKISVEAGVYSFGGYVQGRALVDGESYQVFVTVGDKTYTADLTPNGWAVWQNGEVKDVTVAEAAEITVGFTATASAGAWGTWDDFYLYRIGDAPAITPDEKPGEETETKPDEKPSEGTETTPTEKPSEGTETAPTEKPGEGTETTPSEKPGEGTETTPTEKPSEGTEITPTEKPSEGTETTPSGNSDQKTSSGTETTTTEQQQSTEEQPQQASGKTLAPTVNKNIRADVSDNAPKARISTNEKGEATLKTLGKTSEPVVLVRSKATINGVTYNITSVAKNAFAKCGKDTWKVTLSKSIHTLEDNAFTGSKLTQFNVYSRTAMEISDKAFEGVDTSKMTVKVTMKMSKKEFRKMTKALRAAGFKGKIVQMKYH